MDGLPEKIGPWKVLEFVAQGGNGVVYKAVRQGDAIALKVLKARSGEAYERFTREIGFLREHQDVPGVLPLIDAYLPEVPSRADRAWLAMPLAIPIEQVLEGRPLQDAVDAVRRISETLADLKKRSGVAHRDIKPGNLYELDGQWLIGDFGLISIPGAEPLTGDGRQVGPVNYTAWEMIDHPSTADPHPADVYSLGKTLWVLATGQHWPPLGHQRAGSSSIGDYRAHRNAPRLDELVERMTRDDPVQRPTMEAVAADLSAWQELDAAPASFDLSDRWATIRPKLQQVVADHQAAEQLQVDYQRAIRRLGELTRPLNEQLKHLFPTVEVDSMSDEMTKNTVKSGHEWSGQTLLVNRWHRCTTVTVGEGASAPGLKMARSLEVFQDGTLAFTWMVLATKHSYMGGSLFYTGPTHGTALAGSVQADRMLESQVKAMGDALKKAVDALGDYLPDT